MREERIDDRKVEVIIGHLLRIGVILAAAVVLAGAIVFLSRHGSAPPSRIGFRGEPTALRSFPGAMDETLHGSGRGIIAFGLLLLIVTPIARVAFSAVAFVLERDWLYTVVTLIVLSLLLYSLIFGTV
jgi:uncharacterized membrane protein